MFRLDKQCQGQPGYQIARYADLAQLARLVPRESDRRTKRRPTRSDSIPQKGHATKATSSSAKPRLPTASPTPSLSPMRSVITNETEELRKTRKAIEKGQTPRRYVAVCNLVAGNMIADSSNAVCLEDHKHGEPVMSLLVRVCI
jgi:hypothetical protein